MLGQNVCLLRGSLDHSSLLIELQKLRRLLSRLLILLIWVYLTQYLIYASLLQLRLLLLTLYSIKALSLLRLRYWSLHQLIRLVHSLHLLQGLFLELLYHPVLILIRCHLLQAYQSRFIKEARLRIAPNLWGWLAISHLTLGIALQNPCLALSGLEILVLQILLLQIKIGLSVCLSLLLT